MLDQERSLALSREAMPPPLAGCWGLVLASLRAEVGGGPGEPAFLRGVESAQKEALLGLLAQATQHYGGLTDGARDDVAAKFGITREQVQARHVPCPRPILPSFLVCARACSGLRARARVLLPVLASLALAARSAHVRAARAANAARLCWRRRRPTGPVQNQTKLRPGLCQRPLLTPSASAW